MFWPLRKSLHEEPCPWGLRSPTPFGSEPFPELGPSDLQRLACSECWQRRPWAWQAGPGPDAGGVARDSRRDRWFPKIGILWEPHIIPYYHNSCSVLVYKVKQDFKHQQYTWSPRASDLRQVIVAKSSGLMVHGETQHMACLLNDRRGNAEQIHHL